MSAPSDVTIAQKNNYIKFRAKMTPAGSYYNVGAVDANNVEYDDLLSEPEFGLRIRLPIATIG